MVLIVLAVSIVALVAIGNIVWRIVSPGVNQIVAEVSSVVRINRLNYNFELPPRVEITQESNTETTTNNTPQEVITEQAQANLNYNFSIDPQPNTTIVKGVPNFFEELYADTELGPIRIQEESNKNIIIDIPKLSVSSPSYQTPDGKSALKFGFWLHRSSFPFGQGELAFLCNRRFFDSNDPRSCYYLNFLNINDQIVLEFAGERVTYKINKITSYKSDYSEIYNSITEDPNQLRLVSTLETDSGRGRVVFIANKV